MEKALENRNKILEIIKVKGPVIPVQVSKDIGMNILMSSAHLAELTASNLVKISHVKVGGSPVYYLPGQESMLQKFTGSLNDKEKKAYDLLNNSKVLRDREQEPVIRVALRELRDFAKPLNVTYNDQSEIFWKWYLISDEEASNLIKPRLELPNKEVPQQEARKKEPRLEQNKESFEKPVQKTIAKQNIQQTIPEKQEKINENITEKAPAIQKEKIKKPKQDKEDEFLSQLSKFFEKSSIQVISSEVIRKNAEIDLIVEIPSVVGNLQYYCKAKNKKRVSDSDLSSAYVKGQLRKLPVLFISTGELSTKAESMLTKELNLAFKKI